MLKYFVALAASLVALGSYAATTWTTPSVSTKYVASKAVSTTGNEACPTSASAGDSIENISTYEVTLEMETLDGGVFVNADGSTTAAFYGGKVYACHYNPVSASWSRVPALDLTVTAGVTKQTWTGIAVGLRVGRMAYVPYDVGPGGTTYFTALRGQ